MEQQIDHTVYLALGSNLGERAENLHCALRSFPPHVQVLAASSVYETQPWGYLDQPPFLNQVIAAKTRLTPQALLVYLKQIEEDMGRQATFRYGPRLIDLDILFYDDVILNLPGLTIPHPQLAERAFVLVPLAELNPDLLHPLLGKTIRQLLAKIDTGGVRKVATGSSQEG